MGLFGLTHGTDIEMSESDRNIANRQTNFSLREEQVAAQYSALWGRTAALLVIALLVTLLVPWPGPVYLYLLLLVFCIIRLGRLVS